MKIYFHIDVTEQLIYCFQSCRYKQNGMQLSIINL